MWSELRGQGFLSPWSKLLCLSYAISFLVARVVGFGSSRGFDLNEHVGKVEGLFRLKRKMLCLKR